MTKSKIVSRTASASLALSGSQLLAKLIDFFLVLVLARLLTPEDFALIAIAMIFVQVTEAILQMHVGAALIRSKRVTRDMLYTAFSISILRSVIVVGIILVLTPVAAFMFNEPRLNALMPVLALAPAVRGLFNPKMTLLARRINYYPEAIIGIIARATTMAIALPFAIITKSYWALVLMTVLTPAFLTMATYLYVPFLPKWSLKSWPIFANMIGWTTVSQFFSAAHWQLNVFVLAQYSSRTTTGNYSVGSNLNGIVHQAFLRPLLVPFISTFSLLQKEGSLETGYLTSSRVVLLATGPIFVILSVLAGPIVLFLFGQEWQEAPAFLAILAACSLLSAPTGPAGSVAYAQDRTVFYAIHNAVAFVSLAVFLYLGFWLFGLPGFFIAQALGAVVFFGSALWMVKQLLNLHYVKQIKVLVMPYLSLVIMALFLWFTTRYVIYDSPWLLLLSIASLSAISVLVYVLTVSIFWNLMGKPDGVERKVYEAVFKRHVSVAL